MLLNTSKTFYQNLLYLSLLKTFDWSPLLGMEERLGQFLTLMSLAVRMLRKKHYVLC